jgi:hypothetical protein
MRRRLSRSVLNCIICIILDRSIVQSPNRSCPLLMESLCTLYPSSKPPLPYLDLSRPIREGCSLHSEVCIKKSHSLDAPSSAVGLVESNNAHSAKLLL